MRLLDFPGAQYVDAAPDGRFVASFLGGTIKTSNGEFTFTVADRLLRFVRIGPPGRFAGVGGDDHAWEWDGTKWVDHGMAFGPESVEYDNNGQLHVHRGPFATGIRYFDEQNRLVSCSDTRADVARRIWEFTTRVTGLGPVTVGHGGPHVDPVLALINGTRRVIQEGIGRFVIFRKEGNSVSIAWVNLADDTGYALIGAVAELLTFPEDAAPPPPPPPPPPPDPMPYERRSPNYSSKVAEFAARFPQLWQSARERPDGTKDDAMIRKLASWMHAKVDPNIGLNGKRGGDKISTDALAYKNPTAPGGAEVIDVIIGDEHRPGWLDVTLPDVKGRFIQPVPWEEPGPADPPPPAECKCEPFDPSGLQKQIEALTARVRQLEEQPEPEYMLVGDPDAPKVGVSRGLFGHSHDLRAKVVRKQ